MTYDDYKSTEDDEHWTALDPDDDEQRDRPPCSDCGGDTSWGATSTPVDGGRRYCQTCARWRDLRRLIFDPRHRDVLESEVA